MPDLDDILKMAQAAQAQMMAAQADLDTIDVEGSAGAGAVKVVATARGVIKSVTIDDALMADGDKAMIEDLLVAALNDARAKADQQSSAHMQAMTAGLSLPPGMKLPF